MLGCNEYMIVGVLPDISHEFGDSLSQLGLLVTVFAIVYAISTPLITSLANRWQRHRVLLFLMVVFFIGNTWTALSHNFVSLLLSRILTSCVAGAIISLVLVMANYIAPHDKRASLLSWVFAGFSIASVIGIPIGTVISTTFSWHDSFWMITALTIIVFLALLWLVPRDTPQVKSSFAKQFTLFQDRRIIIGVIFVITVCASDYSIYTYIRPLITNVMGFDNTWLNWLLFAQGIVFIIGNKFGGRRRRPRRDRAFAIDLHRNDHPLLCLSAPAAFPLARRYHRRSPLRGLFVLWCFYPADVPQHC